MFVFPSFLYQVGQAQALGLQENDIITAVNDNSIAPGTTVPTLKVQL
jgi:hypothetical protein